MNPLTATALIVVHDERGSFVGTALAYRSHRHYLTAAHCLGDFAATDVSILAPGVAISGAAELVAVESVFRHPDADLAVLELGVEIEHGTPYTGVVDRVPLGVEFYAYGYPEDALLGEGVVTPRLFVGHYQRFFGHHTPRYKYHAGEMSVPAPAGLSGGPVFDPTASSMLTGIVTANVESGTAPEVYEETVDPSGGKQTITHRRVISYGIALMLNPLAEWLSEHVENAP